MEVKQKEVVRSILYFTDFQNSLEYGEATFGEKAAMFFLEDLKIEVRKLELQ